MSACRQEEKTVSGITFLTRLRKVKVQKIAANSQTYVVCFQIESYLDSLNLLRILLSFIVHVACRVNKKFGNTKNSVNLFPDDKR